MSYEITKTKTIQNIYVYWNKAEIKYEMKNIKIRNVRKRIAFTWKKIYSFFWINELIISELQDNFYVKKVLLCFSELLTWLSQKLRNAEKQSKNLFFHEKWSCIWNN